MGWAGLKNAQNVDPFIAEMISSGKFIQVDQTPWLFSHSGMKIPTKVLFDNVIKKRIMDEFIMKGDGVFGRY